MKNKQAIQELCSIVEHLTGMVAHFAKNDNATYVHEPRSDEDIAELEAMSDVAKEIARRLRIKQ